jgi:hypothetical protein
MAEIAPAEPATLLATRDKSLDPSKQNIVRARVSNLFPISGKSRPISLISINRRNQEGRSNDHMSPDHGSGHALHRTRCDFFFHPFKTRCCHDK